MRWSQTLIPTQKQDPADATIASHKLLVRGGFVRQLSAGHYTFLPMGWRTMRKIMGIIREEMEAAGATEVSLPCLQPIELWQESGRDEKYGDDMFRLTDRRGSRQALAPTHEESVTEFVRAFVKSYKQLPLNVWQMQTKFRDEPRPRSGLLRVREFIMKDAYSLDADEAGLDKSFQAMRATYKSIYARCGVPAIEVDADSGAIGGSESIEFTVPCDAGEDVVVTSDKGNYAANVEKADIGERPFDLDGEPTGELEKVHTPDMPGIELVCKHLKVKPPRMLKTLVFTRLDGQGFVIGVVPGDKQVNAAKLQEAAGVGSIELDEASARAAGFAIGYVGPQVVVGRKDTFLVVDPDAAQPGFWATGANRRDYHVKHFNWDRDVVAKQAAGNFDRTDAASNSLPGAQAEPPILDSWIEPRVADIRDAVDGDPSPLNDGGVLKESRGVEVGHVFKLGTVYSEKMGATFLDENNAEKPVIMGCYGIGVGRILLSAVETSHDDRGIIWPINIAPYEVVVTPIKYDGVAKTKADAIYDELKAKGVDVLLDDRDDRPGSKFADADLIGIPLRVVVGDRGLSKGVVELKSRRTGETRDVEVADVVPEVQNELRDEARP
jgi:prolyl-tRNA synthetase